MPRLFSKSKLSKRKIFLLGFLGIGIFLLWLGFFGQNFFVHQKKNADQKTIDTFLNPRLTECSQTKYREKCLKELSQELLDQFNLLDVSNTMFFNQQEEPYFSMCHQLSHHLGRLEYKRLKSIPKVFSEIEETCNGGAYHGAVEGYFMSKNIIIDAATSTDPIIGKEIEIVCASPDDYKRSQDYFSCIHGLGHALMFATDNELVRSLNLCDYLKLREDQTRCYSGALMQNYTSINSIEHPTIYAKKDEPMFPCYILDKKYQHMCYTFGVLTNYQRDANKSVELCESVPKIYARDCFRTFGRDRTMITKDPQKINQMCNLTKNVEYRSGCIDDAAYALVTRYGAQSSLATELCSIQSAIFQNSCFGRVLQSAQHGTRDKEQVLSLCKTFPINSQNLCQSIK